MHGFIIEYLAAFVHIFVESLLHCQELAKIRYRIQFDASYCWILVCPDCWQKLAIDNPFYRYGGTWKAK